MPEPGKAEFADVLQVKDLHFAHADSAPLFDGWSASLAAGAHWLDGESGSGKTTLLRLLAGDLAGSGQRRLCGAEGLDGDADPAGWRRAVCFVDAGDEAFDGLTPAALRDLMRGRHPQLDTVAWQRHIDGLALAPHVAKTMHMLSTGMRRKAALAGVLASGARLILLDEPLAGLDGPAVDWLVAALAKLAQQPGCVLLVACGTWPVGLPRAGHLRLGSA